MIHSVYLEYLIPKYYFTLITIFIYYPAYFNAYQFIVSTPKGYDVLDSVLIRIVAFRIVIRKSRNRLRRE